MKMIFITLLVPLSIFPRLSDIYIYVWTARKTNQSILKDQSWIFIGRTDAEVETPILWPSDAKNQLIGKDPDPGKDCRQEEKGMTEDEMVGWHHQLNEHEFEQTPGIGEGQGSLACCGPRGLQRVGHDWTTKQQQQHECPTLTWCNVFAFFLTGLLIFSIYWV